MTRGEVNGRLRLGLRTDVDAFGFLTGPGGTRHGTLQGLPVLAIPLIQAKNGNNQPGVLANYGFTGHVVRRQAGGPVF